MAHRLQVLSAHLRPAEETQLQCRNITQVAMAARSPITTHVLDTSLGRPGRGVPVELSCLDTTSGKWEVLARGATNDDGRCSNLLPPGQLKPGTYRMNFDTKTYFESLGNYKAFYPYVDVVVCLEEASQHYHIPLLLSTYSYTTYRGS